MLISLNSIHFDYLVDVAYTVAALAVSIWGNYHHFRKKGWLTGVWRVGAIAFWGFFIASAVTGGSLRAANVGGTVMAVAVLAGALRIYKPWENMAVEEGERERSTLAPFVKRYRTPTNEDTGEPT